jgi:ADP-ribose pyrophosphatase YjhB (NUDIX family)
MKQVFTDAEYKKITSNLPRACVDDIIEYKGKFLLVRRAIKPLKGKYYFVGGRIFHGEQIKDAALRIAKSEVGLDCEFLKVVGFYEAVFGENEVGAKDHSIVAICHLEALNDHVILDFQHSDYKWVNKVNFSKKELGWQFYKLYEVII